MLSRKVYQNFPATVLEGMVNDTVLTSTAAHTRWRSDAVVPTRARSNLANRSFQSPRTPSFFSSFPNYQCRLQYLFCQMEEKG